MPHRPAWFSNDKVMVSTAPTCGLTRGGRALLRIDPATGKPFRERDPDTGDYVPVIDDQLGLDAAALAAGKTTDTLHFLDQREVSTRCAVPVYYDARFTARFREAMSSDAFEGFRYDSLKGLQEKGLIEIRRGHGSPTPDERIGDVPYIKVSDLRAGLVNINPTNRVPRAVAESYWKAKSSGLRAFDLLCPERTSKNIGDFCVLMPGQERVVTTREVIVLRPGPAAEFDPFYLLWAMTLTIVRNQWKRIIFMQTNREDVGLRYLEVEIPIAPTKEIAFAASDPLRQYYRAVAAARERLSMYLNESKAHHFFVSGAEDPEIIDATIEDVTRASDDRIAIAELEQNIIPGGRMP